MEILNELSSFYYRLVNNPNSYSYYDKPVRQGKINRFAYLLVYEFFNVAGTIVVYTVFMAKQNPAKKRTL